MTTAIGYTLCVLGAATLAVTFLWLLNRRYPPCRFCGERSRPDGRLLNVCTGCQRDTFAWLDELGCIVTFGGR